MIPQDERAEPSHLPSGVSKRIELLYADALQEFSERIVRHSAMKPHSDKEIENVVRLSVALLASGVYSGGVATLNLYQANLHKQLPGLVRSQFEASIRIAYIEKHNIMARNFLDSEPFERWFLASEYSKKLPLLKTIEAECFKIIKERPDLVGDQKDSQSILAGKIPPNYSAVRKKLQFKATEQLMNDLRKTDSKWKADLYVTLFRMGSQSIHNEIGFLRNALADLNNDGSVHFSIDQREDGAPDYLFQSSNYIIGCSGKFGFHFGDDVTKDANLNDLVKRHSEIVAEVFPESTNS